VLKFVCKEPTEYEENRCKVKEWAYELRNKLRERFQHVVLWFLDISLFL